MPGKKLLVPSAAAVRLETPPPPPPWLRCVLEGAGESPPEEEVAGLSTEVLEKLPALPYPPKIKIKGKLGSILLQRPSNALPFGKIERKKHKLYIF